MHGSPGRAERLLYTLHERRLPELMARHVDRHADRSKSRRLPRLGLRARGAEYPATDRHDQTRIFRNGYEF